MGQREQRQHSGSNLWQLLFKGKYKELGPSQMGRDLGYDKSTLCQVAKGTYKGSTNRIAVKVMEVYGVDENQAKDNGVPEGYMRNGVGHLVPIETINQGDLLRDQLVRDIVAVAELHAMQTAQLKTSILDDIQAFVDLSAERYGKSLGGIKGNVTLHSFDGKYRIIRDVSDTIVFDEQLQVAKELVGQCIRKWSTGSQPEMVALINDAFQVDKKGNLNTARILGLRRLDIKDGLWKKAMEAISNSLSVTGSKTYVRAYKREGSANAYQRISMDRVAG